MIAICRTISLVAAALFTAGAAHAEAPDKRVADFLRSSETRMSVAKAVHQQVTTSPLGCKEVKIGSDSRFQVLAPIEFAGDAKVPAKGMWIESMTVKACGVDRRHNIQSAARDGKIQMIGRVNGASIASIVLQRDALPIVATAALPHAGDGCDKSAVIDTAFNGFEGEPIAGAKDGPKSRLWREDWTVWACGKELIVPVVFTPDATGTGIAADASGARVK